MLNYKFVKASASYRRQYEHFPLPAILCDRAFAVYWSNDLARSVYPVATETSGLATLLAQYEPKRLLQKIEDQGSHTIRDFLPKTGISITLLPVLEKESMVGCVVLIIPTENCAWRESAYWAAQATQALSGSIHEWVADLFETMDAAAIKADLLHNDWIHPTFSRMEMDSYHILRVVENMSIYTQLQSGLWDLQLRGLDPSDLLRDNVEVLKELCRGANVPLEFLLPKNPCMIAADRSLLEVALYNLLHNSLYYTRLGNTLRIEIREIESPSRKVLISVRDSGLGIPQEEQERVWKPYYSYRHGGERAGAGLGLSLVRAVIESHGGMAELRSEPGVGTEVTLHLPVLTAGVPISLRQERTFDPREGRFSRMMVGLFDVTESPHNPHHTICLEE